jgi:hypothetical protein
MGILTLFDIKLRIEELTQKIMVLIRWNIFTRRLSKTKFIECKIGASCCLGRSQATLKHGVIEYKYALRRQIICLSNA